MEWIRASGSKRSAVHAIEVSAMPATPDADTVVMRLGPSDEAGWSVPRIEWAAFIEAVKAGEFDNI